MKYFPFRGIIVQLFENDTLDMKFQYFGTINIGDKINGS